MSFGTFCGQDPTDPDTFQRVLAKYLDESVQPAQQDLTSVLTVGNDGGHLAIVNGGAFGCDALSTPFGYIDALDATEISDITNVLGLKINPVGALKIKGAETKGNILVGDGTNTVGVAVGTNGYVLTANSGETAGVKWESAGGAGVASITAGSNIGVNNAIPTAPVVSLLSPLTSTLNMGAVAITDSASATGTSGQYLTAGTGGQTLWATLPTKVSSITAGNNIGITGTATVPIVSLLSPLTSTLALGTQSITGSTSNITLSSGTNQANMNGNLGFTSVVQATPTTKANLFNTSISVETVSNKVQMTPTYLLKTVGATAFQIGTVGSAPINLVGAGGGADGISITQLANVGTTLTTGLSNVKYYPDTYLSNQNLNSVSVPLPQVDYQRLTLNNLGLTNTSTWTDYGNAVYAGYSTFTIDSGGNYWYAEQNSGNITVIDSTSAVVAQLQLNYGINVGIINTFYEQGGYMFIGGRFDSVADAGGVNATPQYSIARVNSSTYFFDPMEDPSILNRGFTAGSEVYCITDVNGALVCGGSFQTNSLATLTINYIGAISNPYVAGSNQVWTEFGGGVNAIVYAILHESSLNYTFVGGDFTSVDVAGGGFGYQFCSYYDNGSATWFSVAGNNFNAGVRVIKPAPTSVLFVAGNFSQIAGTGQNYNTYIDPATPSNWSDTNLPLISGVNYKEAQYGGGYMGVWESGSNLFYQSSALGVWTSLLDPAGFVSGSLMGIIFSGDWRVVYSAYTYIRLHSNLPHSCEFQGSFKYDNNTYSKYTIITRNVSQQFIGDETCSFWSIIGQGVGTFS